MKKPGDSFLGKLMQGLFAFFVLQLLQKVFPENEESEESECQNREGCEEKKDRWAKLVEVLGKPLYGNIALVIIQILIFALINAAALEQEWYLDGRLIVFIPIYIVEAICIFIYLAASKRDNIAIRWIVGILVSAIMLGGFAFLDLKGAVDYWGQLVFQSISLTVAMFASMEIKSGHTGS